jgi:hypothetical protein
MAVEAVKSRGVKAVEAVKSRSGQGGQKQKRRNSAKLFEVDR